MPELFAVSGSGIGGGAHANEVERLIVGREVEVEDTSGVVVAFDDAPACEVGCFDSCDFLPVLCQVPKDDFPHEVSGSEKFAVI